MESFGSHFGIILGSMLGRFGTILGSIWIHFGVILVHFGDLWVTLDPLGAP